METKVKWKVFIPQLRNSYLGVYSFKALCAILTGLVSYTSVQEPHGLNLCPAPPLTHCSSVTLSTILNLSVSISLSTKWFLELCCRYLYNKHLGLHFYYTYLLHAHIKDLYYLNTFDAVLCSFHIMLTSFQVCI